MIRITKTLTFIAFTLSLTACTLPATQQMLSDIRYQKPIHLHINKDALLALRVGYVVPANQSMGYYDTVVNGGLIGAAANMIGAGIVKHHNDHPNPRYRYQFGEYRQAIFMRSLYNTLKKNHVFHSIKMVHTVPPLRASQAAIIVNFKSTKVENSNVPYQITLDVALTLKTKNHTYQRVFFIQSEKKVNTFSKDAFEQHQVEIAHKLLNRIIETIHVWSTTMRGTS